MPPSLLLVLAFLVLFAAHSLVLGLACLPKAVTQRLQAHENNPFLLAFFALTMGLFANIALLFTLGLAGWFTPLGIATLGLAALCAGAVRITKNRLCMQLKATNGTGMLVQQSGAWLVLACVFLLCALAALRPPGHFDDTMYHLPLARSYVQHQGIVLQEYLRFPLFPQNMNLLFGLGLMFGGEPAAQALAALPVFVMSLGALAGLVYLTGSIPLGLVAAALLIMAGPTKRMLAFAYVDNGLGMFCGAAVLAMALWAAGKNSKEQSGWLMVAGLMAGAAAGTKYFGVVLAGVLGLYLLGQRQWRACFIYGACVTAAGCWWYVRSFVISGDPIHPAGGNLFGFYLWDAADLAYQKAEQATHGVNKNPLYLWSALNEAHVKFWVLAFLGLFLRNVPKPVRALQAAFIGYFIFWFFVTQVWRYLAPIHMVGALLSCYTLYRWYLWLPKPAVLKTATSVSVAVALLVLGMAGYTYDRFNVFYQQGRNWHATLAETSGYTLFQRANTYIPTHGERLVQLGFEHRRYFFDGTVIGDWFGPGRYRNLLHCDPQRCLPLPPTQMRDYLQKAGSRLLIVSLEQYPGFDANAYSGDFSVLYRTDDGVLLGLK